MNVSAACGSLGFSRAAFYRHRVSMSSVDRPRNRRCPPPRKLSAAERERVIETLNDEENRDKSPSQVYAELLSRDTYLCSIRTMYRILKEQQQVRERRDQLRHPVYAKPELLATEPNQVWSWDITKLPGPRKWTYYYLYVVLDIYSRYVVGWQLADCESSRLAVDMVETTAKRQCVEPGQLTIHADRGPAMRSLGLAQLLAQLGITKTHSRPYTSNDNPFSESQFKTMKYRPEFPDRFGSYEDCHRHSKTFFEWYNREHCHSGLGLHTPEDVHFGRAREVQRRRAATLLGAYARNPERFVKHPPKPPDIPAAVWINPPKLPSSGYTQTLIQNLSQFC